MDFSFIDDKPAEPEIIEQSQPEEKTEIKPLKFDITAHAAFNEQESTLVDLYKKFDIVLTKWETEVERLTVDKWTIQNADTMKKQLTEVFNAVEGKRSELKAPFLDHGRVIDRFAKKIKDRLNAMKATVSRKMLPALKEVEAENKKLDAAKAQTTKRVEKQKIEKQKTVLKKTHTRKVWVWEVKDAEKIPRKYLCIDKVAINKAVRAGKRKIDGLKIFQKESVV